MKSLRSRIVGEGMESPEQLLANPFNWRKHPREQKRALEGVLKEVGWVQRIIVNRRTGHIVDGHLRVEVAMQRDESAVPVLYVDLSENEEKIILSAIDPIGGMAETDQKMLDDLLKTVSSVDEDLTEFLSMLKSDKPLDDVKNIDDISPELPGAMALKPDMGFQSDLIYGIPPIRDDLIYDSDWLSSMKCWAGNASEDDGTSLYLWNFKTDSLRGLDKKRCIIGFYTDDGRFECMWEKPAEYAGRMINMQCVAAMSPNYSLWANQAKAVHIWNTYRARWVGRYLQEAGIPLIPDVNWAGRDSFEFCTVGIPKYCKTISVQLQTLNSEADVIAARSGLKFVLNEICPGRVIVYGHANAKAIAEELELKNFVYVENRAALRRAYIEERSKNGKNF